MTATAAVHVTGSKIARLATLGLTPLGYARPAQTPAIQTTTLSEPLPGSSALPAAPLLFPPHATPIPTPSPDLPLPVPPDISLLPTSIRPTPTDSVPSSAPGVRRLTPDELRMCLGYRNVSDYIRVLPRIASPTVKVVNIIDPTPQLGDVATIERRQRNTTPLPLPNSFGDTVHCDIAYGKRTALTGIKYVLLLVDRATRKKFVYGMQNLTSDVQASMEQFIVDCGNRAPKRLLTDFDSKIMGGATLELLRRRGCSVAAAPAARQSQNGLVERAWRTVVRMARAWVNQHLLPTEYWYHAIRRAVEVCNFLPVTANGVLTTPHELTHGTKPDLRNLFPLFSIAYIHRTRDGDTDRTRFAAQALRCIVIGSDPRSDGLLFYHPPTKQYMSSSDYALDTTRPSGPAFSLLYDGGIFVGLYDKTKKNNLAPFDPGTMCDYCPESCPYPHSSPQSPQTW